MKILMPLIATISLLVASATQAAPIIVGNNDSGNSYPFSGFASDQTGTTYQQVYSASAFSGPINIGSISFFRQSGTLMDTATYTVSFSTTSAAVNGLSTTWANNIGPDSQIFGNFSISGVMPPVLTLTGSTPFLYDPALGNLLMTVQVTSLTEPHDYESYFQADYTGVVTRRLFARNGSATGQSDIGALVTQFDAAPLVAEVPEPASLAVWSLISVAGIAAWRRRTPAARA